MSMLEKLPNLQKLKLGTCSFVWKEMACHATGFPQLRSLSLSSLGNLEKWVIEDGAMPNLSHLEIYECLQLQMIPDGIRFLGSLKKMNIVHMPEEFCARVHVNDDGREGIDFHKVIHVHPLLPSPYDHP
ncbi:hypothetical protein Leryth_023975 [Lithospermum erythrorhizon]|nr:hypothetical protein Leryth_023975 [Lithospermum erythrorhizon]